MNKQPNQNNTNIPESNSRKLIRYIDFVFEQISWFLKLVYMRDKLACAYPCVQCPGIPLRRFAGYDSHNWFSSCMVVLPDIEMALDLSAEDILNVKLLKFV